MALLGPGKSDFNCNGPLKKLGLSACGIAEREKIT